mmetsp:Transcript_31886/g.123747  ORF Transcript_31886/g.123747 Transcript_31886/m.123747 type:complete len:150 (+) Transcript_31886:956-1405(+)
MDEGAEVRSTFYSHRSEQANLHRFTFGMFRLQDLIGLFLAGVFYQYRVIFYYLVARFVPFLQDWADRSARKYMAYMASESDTDISELTADVGYNYWNMHLDRVATYLGLRKPQEPVSFLVSSLVVSCSDLRGVSDELVRSKPCTKLSAP